MIVQQQTFRINESVVVAELEGETVLLDVDSGVYYGLNEIGSEIWKRLGERKPADQIVSELLDEYDIDASTLRHDVAEYIDRLVASGLAFGADD